MRSDCVISVIHVSYCVVNMLNNAMHIAAIYNYTRVSSRDLLIRYHVLRLNFDRIAKFTDTDTVLQLYLYPFYLKKLGITRILLSQIFRLYFYTHIGKYIG